MLSFGHAAYFGVGHLPPPCTHERLQRRGPAAPPLMPLAGAAVGLLTGIIAAGWFATQRTGRTSP